MQLPLNIKVASPPHKPRELTERGQSKTQHLVNRISTWRAASLCQVSRARIRFESTEETEQGKKTGGQNDKSNTEHLSDKVLVRAHTLRLKVDYFTVAYDDRGTEFCWFINSFQEQ